MVIVMNIENLIKISDSDEILDKNGQDISMALVGLSSKLIDWNSQEEFPYWDKEDMISILEGDGGELENYGLVTDDLEGLVDLILSDFDEETPAKHSDKVLRKAAKEGLVYSI